MPTFRQAPLLVPVGVVAIVCSCSSGLPSGSEDAGGSRPSVDASDHSTSRSSVNITESSAVVLGSTTVSGATSALLSSAMPSSVRATESSTTVASTRSAAASSKSTAASTMASSSSPSASTTSSRGSTESTPSGTGTSHLSASTSSSESHGSTPSSSEQTGPASTSSSSFTTGSYECSVAEELATVEVVDARTLAPVVDATLSLVQGGEVMAGTYAWNDSGSDGGLTGTYTVGDIGGYFVQYDSFLVSAPGYAPQLVTEVTPGFPGEPRYCGGVATPTSAYAALIPLGVGEAGDGGLDGGTGLVEAGVTDGGGSGPSQACVRVKAYVSGEAVLTLRADTIGWQSISGCAPGLDPRCAGDSGPTELSFAGTTGAFCPTWNDPTGTVVDTCAPRDAGACPVSGYGTSLPFVGLTPPLPATAQTVTVDATACPGSCTVVLSPSAEDGYEAIVDLAGSGSAPCAELFDVTVCYAP